MISGAASTVWGWIKSAKEWLGSAWDWVVERLGLGGADSQDGVWAWIKRHAARAWDGIKQTLAPVVGPLTTAGKVLFLLSPFGPVYVLITYGPEVVKVVAFLWSHRNDPDIVRTAHKEMSDTFLPGLLDRTGNLRQKLGEAADWLLEQLSSLASAALALAGSISGLPLLDAAKGFAQRLAEDVRSFFSWGQEKLRDGVQWLTGAATKLWSIVEPYKEVLGSIALAIAAPPTIPLILAGWAWRKIPRCYKAPIIDFILDIVLGALSALSALATFGPLWALLKPAIMAFLRKLKQAQDWVKEKVSDRVAKILSGASLEFLLGFVKGFLQGIWEGLDRPVQGDRDGDRCSQLDQGPACGRGGARARTNSPAADTQDHHDHRGRARAGEAQRGGRGREQAAVQRRASVDRRDATRAARCGGAGLRRGSGPARAARPRRSGRGAGRRGRRCRPRRGFAFRRRGAFGHRAGRGSEPPATASGTAEPATDHVAPTIPAPEAATAPSTATAASTPAATGGAPGGSTLAGPGSAQTSDVPQAVSAAGGAAAQLEQAVPAATPATAKGPVIPGQAATPASPPPVPNQVGPQPDIAEVARQAISDIEPDVDKAATGFWPAIKEYFSSGSSTSFDELLAKLGEAWDAIKAKIAAAGTELAKKVTGFFASDQAEEETGHATGWLGGTITFQVLLDALTAGTWTGIMGVLQSIAKFINWPMEVMGEAFKLLSKLGAYLLDGLKALAKVVKEAGGDAIRAVMDAVSSIARKFVQVAETLVGRVGGAVERRGAAALEREGGRLAETEAARLEQKELTQGLEREGAKAGPAARDAKQAGAAQKDAEQALREEEEAAQRQRKATEREHEPGDPGDKLTEEPRAIVAARAIDALMEPVDAPAGFVRLALLKLRRNFHWIKDFELAPSAPGVYDVFMLASRKLVGVYRRKTRPGFRERPAPRIDQKGRKALEADTAFSREVDDAIDKAVTEGSFVQGGETYYNKGAVEKLESGFEGRYGKDRLARERDFTKRTLEENPTKQPVVGVESRRLESAVKQSQKSLKDKGLSGGLRPEEYGTLLHTELRQTAEKRIGKKLAPGTEFFNDQALAEIKKLAPGEADLTVAKWLNHKGIPDPGLSRELLQTPVGALKPDLVFREPGGAYQVIDLTGQPRSEHLAKTIFYTVFLGAP